MERTAKHAPFGDRPGLFRRLMGRRAPESLPMDGPPAHSVDLTEDPGEMVLARIERLERGMHLMAEAMKSTYGRLTAAVEDTRRQADRGPASERLQRLRDKAMHRVGVDAPLNGPVVPGGMDALVPDALTNLRRARFARPEADTA